MDPVNLVSPIKNIVTGLWNCAVHHSAYIRHLDDNVTSLEEETRTLDAIFKDVDAKVKLEEEHYKKRTNEVECWLERTVPMIKEANELLQKGKEEIQKKCLGGCCPRNCRTSYKLGKEVNKKIEDVKKLVNEGHFSVFAERLPLSPVDQMPVEKTVGMESKLSEVWRCVEDPSVGVIGLYGIGGVGKTTLLKKLNNKFMDTGLGFEVVIYVTVSKEVKMFQIQEVIRQKLGIPEEIWKEKIDDNARASEILGVLRSKKFVLLLDDLWEPIDLLKVGVPDPGNGKGCKIVLTSRLEDVCRRMGSRDRGSFKMQCLSRDEALDLFRKMVTEDVLKSHHEIPKLAAIVAEECKGLPLALITIGSAMANRRKPEEWHHAINILKTNPSKLPGVENFLFSSLGISYDSLSGDAMKNCFLYCSMFPEDHQINRHELINLWIAEGLLDNSSTLDNARDDGEYIIGSLIFACLLERVEVPENHVKMHDILRDFALWIASQKENQILVLETDRLIKKQEITGWQETVRITLWGHLINDCGDSPFCPRLLSFVARDTRLKTFPGAFFESMPALKVLDLQGNIFLQKLPEVTKLIHLKYLNLSDLDIETLPIEVKNFGQLRILLLDGTRRLGIIPEGVISSLSSLQVFSRLSTSSRRLRFQEFWETGFLEEVEQLDNIVEISLTLFTRAAVDQLNSSFKLQSCVKRLIVVDCQELLSLDISLGYFQNLQDLCVQNCPVKDLTCLRHVPQLRFLFAYGCKLLEEIIAYDFSYSENEENLNFFQYLKLLYLCDLPNLKSICRQVIRFPSLERIYVRNCDNLRKLPFKSALDANATNAELIVQHRRRWDQLEWEDEAAKHDFRRNCPAYLASHFSFETKTAIRYFRPVTVTPHSDLPLDLEVTDFENFQRYFGSYYRL